MRDDAREEYIGSGRPNNRQVTLERHIHLYMGRARNYLNWLDGKSAVFWAEKAVALSIEHYNLSEPHDPIRPFSNACWFGQRDIIPPILVKSSFVFVRCFLLLRQFARAVHFIQSNRLHLQSRQFFYYLLFAQIEQEDWANAQTSLYDYETSTIGPYNEHLASLAENMPEMKLNSRIEHLKARVYEAIDRRNQAVTCYCDAAAMDRHAISSIRAMSETQLLNREEMESFIERLSESTMKKESDESDAQEMLAVCKREFDTYGRYVHTFKGSNLVTTQSIDYFTYLIRTKQNNYLIHDSMKIATNLCEIDLSNSYLLQVHISILAEIGDKTALFKISHRLIDTDCEDWLGWYCAGIYYLVVKNNGKAAALLEKALTKNPGSGLAYLALGHAFSYDREHDQAFNAFLMAERLMKGSALPQLYIGLQYGSTGNHVQAAEFLDYAHKIEPDNPLVLQEMGTNAFHLGHYQDALRHFFKAIKIIESNERHDQNHNAEFSSKWAPLLHNIGSVYRKQKNYVKAAEYHRRALSVSAPTCDGYCLLGFALALGQRFEDASDTFQSALSFDRNNQFALEMLKNVMEEISANVPFPFSDDDSDDDDDVKPVVSKVNRLQTPITIDMMAGAGDMMSSTPNFQSTINSPDSAGATPAAPINMRQIHRAHQVRANIRRAANSANGTGGAGGVTRGLTRAPRATNNRLLHFPDLDSSSTIDESTTATHDDDDEEESTLDLN